MKCNFDHTYNGGASLDSILDQWLEKSPLSDHQKKCYSQWLNSDGADMKQALESYFADRDLQNKFTPIWIHSEIDNSMVTLLTDQDNVAEEPGEEGSILAYSRAYGYNQDFLYSDCYGQLSCSSCAVEVLQGKCQNPEPKDEEYDMLDIDLEKPPTQWTRLSCQTVVGKEPLFCRIRKPISV